MEYEGLTSLRGGITLFAVRLMLHRLAIQAAGVEPCLALPNWLLV